MMQRHLTRLTALERRAGINPLSALSDAELEGALNVTLNRLGGDAPPAGLSLSQLIGWLERELRTVH
jgi:hypothetical protein